MSQPLNAKDLLLPISCVGLLVAAGVSWGVMYEKVEGLREQLVEVKRSVVSVDQKLDQILLARTNVSLK